MHVFVVPRRWVLWSVAMFVAVFVLGFISKLSPALRFGSLDVALNDAHSPLADGLALALDALDRPLVVAAILLVVLVVVGLSRGWRRAIATCVIAGLGWLACIPIKAIVAEPRPTLPDLAHPLPVDPSTLSYPSGHVTFAVALGAALAIACTGRRSRAWTAVVAALFAVVVGWSRLYVGVHYLTDVLGAVLTGIAGTLLAAGLWNLLARRVAKRRAPERP